MTAHVQYIKADGEKWVIYVERDAPVTMAGSTEAVLSRGPVPPLTDIPRDAREALRDWLGVDVAVQNARNRIGDWIESNRKFKTLDDLATAIRTGKV